MPNDLDIREACARLLSSPDALARFVGHASADTQRGARFALAKVLDGTLTAALDSAGAGNVTSTCKVVD